MAKWSCLSILVIASVALGYDFLGPESCQGCHPDAYAAWRASAHSRAKESLSQQQQTQARCLSCHSPAESEQRASNIANVTCETCHGGGLYYSARYAMKDAELARVVGVSAPGEKACRPCHDSSSPSLKSFDFVAKLKAIDHWTVERNK